MTIFSRKVEDLWAKKDVRDGQELWLPLVTHLTDTMNVINWLYQHWLNKAQRQLIRQDLSEDDVERLVKFVGFFHDFGKATPAFQTKKSYLHDDDLDNNIMERLLRDGFTGLQDFDVASPDRHKSPHAMAGEALLEKQGLSATVGAIIGGHHGKPCHELFSYEEQASYFSNYYQVDKNGDVQIINQWNDVYNELIAMGFSLINNDSAKWNDLRDVPSINQQQAIILEGLLIMSDWLASSEYWNDDETQPLFPLISIEHNFTDIDEKRRFHSALLIWLKEDEWTPQPVSDVKKLFEKRWRFLPHTVQKRMVGAMNDIHNPGMIIIESGCGTGKTEIALAATEVIAEKTDHNGFFMGLPTQATTKAMYKRVADWLNSIADEQKVKLGLNVMYSNAEQKMPRAENVEERSAVVVNSWFSGKKAILTEFTVATIDHLLMMSLKQKHLFLRHLAMSGKVVVIDEVHSYDVYMSSYLSRTLEWLGIYKVPVIALSATLPAEKRAELLGSYIIGRYGIYPEEMDESDAAYPLMTYTDGPAIHRLSDFPKQSSQRFQVIRLGDDDQLVVRVKKTIAGGGIAGIIVNTVRRAQQISKEFDGIPVLLLHSEFLTSDRAEREDKLIKMIGKGGKRPKQLIVVGTQVLSQSLDIDFDVLFTDIAPVDLLIQRIGRLHRHKIPRPANLMAPQVYLMGASHFADYGGANEAIYEKYYLMKTDYFLGQQLVIPDDVSPLVQRVYSENTDAEVKGLSAAKRLLKSHMEQEEVKAQRYQIEEPMPNDSLHGWLDNDRDGADTNEAIAQASVRDIKETVEVILVQQTDEGAFMLNKNERIRIDDLQDERVAKKVSEETIRLPYKLTPNIAKAIDELEKRTAKKFPYWQDSVWLHDAIALPLDEQKSTRWTVGSNNYTIHYSHDLGLTYEEEECHD